ncbi:hypothetical protein B0H11DRAFT_674421 [Mycena galericulata]|nr:hypothetical protein B0H11DRAFT_674421 [Mycena galericulata]
MMHLARFLVQSSSEELKARECNKPPWFRYQRASNWSPCTRETGSWERWKSLENSELAAAVPDLRIRSESGRPFPLLPPSLPSALNDFFAASLLQRRYFRQPSCAFHSPPSPYPIYPTACCCLARSCENLKVGNPDEDREDVFWHRAVSRMMNRGRIPREVGVDSQLLTKLIYREVGNTWAVFIQKGSDKHQGWNNKVG